MFAGSRLNRQRTVTDLYDVRAIPPCVFHRVSADQRDALHFCLIENGQSQERPCALAARRQSVFSFISACLTSVSQRCAISMRMALDSGSAISRKNRTQIECNRPGSVPIHGLRQPWTGTAQRWGCRRGGANEDLSYVANTGRDLRPP